MKRLLALFLLLVCTATYAQNVKTYIPARAFALLPIVQLEANRLSPEITTPEYFGALIEHESCISLMHSRCWSSVSELKTQREQGVGLGQITRAYTKTGALRFDSLAELRNQHTAELRELSWSSVKQRPDLQIRAIVLMTKGNFRALYPVQSYQERLKMTDAAYNGGLGGLRSERRACGLSANCDPQLWTGNVELLCLKSKAALYGQRSACDINRHHVSDVTQTRMSKYSMHIKQVQIP